MWHCCLYILIFRHYLKDHRRRMLLLNFIIYHMLAACAWMIKIPTKKQMLPAWMIKVPAKLHFSLETGAAVSFKSGQLFQRAEKKFAETYFLKIVLSPHLRAWLACLADQTPIWSFRRFTYWEIFCSSYIFFARHIIFLIIPHYSSDGLK